MLTSFFLAIRKAFYDLHGEEKLKSGDFLEGGNEK
jgi:hypothetical protein